MDLRATLGYRPPHLAARRHRVRARQVLHDHVVDTVELPLRAGIGVCIQEPRRLALVGPAEARQVRVRHSPARWARERGPLRLCAGVSGALRRPWAIFPASAPRTAPAHYTTTLPYDERACRQREPFRVSGSAYEGA